jgi:hypothetical protein
MFRYDTENGLYIGLRVWLIFLVGLSLLGLPPELCILYGAAVGAAVWTIAAFWKAVKRPEEAMQKLPPQQPSPIRRLPSVLDRLFSNKPNHQKQPDVFRSRAKRRIGK